MFKESLYLPFVQMEKEGWLGDHVIIQMEYDGACTKVATEEVVRSIKLPEAFGRQRELH